MKYEVSHKGEIAQVVRIAGGTVTIKPGAKDVAVETRAELTDDQIEHYKARGVTFKKAGRKSRDTASDKKKAEQEKLLAAVADAEDALAKAETDEAKADAQAALDAAEKALTAASA